MSSSRSGFSLVETLVAMTILSVGIMALAAGSGTVTRTLQRSRISTQAAQYASERMSILRAAARSTLIPCSSTTFTSPGTASRLNVTLNWQVMEATGGYRRIRVIAAYPVGRGRIARDTLWSTIDCD